jgi:hypothetical protein
LITGFNLPCDSFLLSRKYENTTLLVSKSSSGALNLLSNIQPFVGVYAALGMIEAK